MNAKDYNNAIDQYADNILRPRSLNKVTAIFNFFLVFLKNPDFIRNLCLIFDAECLIGFSFLRFPKLCFSLKISSNIKNQASNIFRRKKIQFNILCVTSKNNNHETSIFRNMYAFNHRAFFLQRTTGFNKNTRNYVKVKHKI